MDSNYQAYNWTSIAQKERRTYSVFEANQLLCEGQLSLGQCIEWKRDQTSNKDYLHRDQNQIQDTNSKGLKGSQSDEE